MTKQTQGLSFGRYQLMHRIASGGMGEVFLALTTGVEGFERPVAVKRIYPHLGADEAYRRLFIREAKVTAKLVHPNIVQVYDLGQQDGQLFIAMEYVRGPDVGRVLEHFRRIGQQLDPTIVAVLAFDVLEGLDFAHHLGDQHDTPLRIVHRDISPQNVLLSSPTGIAKLCDFGVVRASTLDVESLDGRVVGKFCYMAPEQALGQPTDGRADLYSVGAVLFEALTGERLVKITTSDELLRYASTGAARKTHELRPDLPPLLTMTIDRALAHDPALRFGSAAQMRDAMGAFLAAGDPRRARDGLRELARMFDDTVVVPAAFSAAKASMETTQRWKDLLSQHDQTGGVSSTVPPAFAEADPDGAPTTQVDAAAISSSAGEGSPPDWPAAPSGPAPWPAPTELLSPPRSAARQQVAGPPRALDKLGASLLRSHRRMALVGIGGLVLLSALIAATVVLTSRAARQPADGGASSSPARPNAASTPVATATEAPLTRPLAPAPDAPIAEPDPGPNTTGAVGASSSEPIAVASPAAEPAGEDGLAQGDGEGDEAELLTEEESANAEGVAPGKRPFRRRDRPVRKGFLEISVKPWAHVSVDGKRIGTTPVRGYALPPGWHTVTIEGPDGRTLPPIKINVLPGKTVRRFLEL